MAFIDDKIALAQLAGIPVTIHGGNASRHAIIADGVVVNVILLDPESEPEWKSDKGVVVPCPEWVSRGCAFDGRDFSSPRAAVKPRETVEEIVERRVRAIDAAFQAINGSLLYSDQQKSAARVRALELIDAVRAAKTLEEIWPLWPADLV